MTTGAPRRTRPDNEMPTPFPGTDPYLESPGVWPNFHHKFLVGTAYALAPLLAPGYYASVEERVYVGLPEDTRAAASIVPDVGDQQTSQGGPTRSSERPAGGVALLARPVPVELPASVQLKEWYLEIREATGTQALITVLELLSPSNKRGGSGRSEYLEKREEVLSSKVHLVEIDLVRRGERLPLLHAPVDYDYSILVAWAGSDLAHTCTRSRFTN